MARPGTNPRCAGKAGSSTRRPSRKIETAHDRARGSFCRVHHVPRAYDVPAAVRIFLDLRNDLVDLIDRPSFGRPPITPLRAINASQISFLIRPLVPDRDAMFIEILD